ncbi:hypothetical protein V1277_002796 [Bradyrhizobium sp. AZCC 1588]
MVSTNPKGNPEPHPGYVHVGWGPEFYTRLGIACEIMHGSHSRKQQ